MTGEPPQAMRHAQKVWDVSTRLVHWAMAFCVAFSWWTVKNDHMDWHYVSGLTLLGLLIFRVWWGFAGPETARFRQFIKGPGAVVAYLGELMKPNYRASFGHNPLGALSVVSMLLALIAQVTLGLFASDTDGLASGPLSKYVDYEFSVQAAELHEDVFKVLLALIALHIAAIAFYAIVKRTNLIGPMITGRRSAINADGPVSDITPAAWWRLGVGVMLAAGVVWLVVR